MKPLADLAVFILNAIVAVLLLCVSVVWIPLTYIAEYFNLFGLKKKDKGP